MLMKYDSASVYLFDSSAAAKCQTSKLLEKTKPTRLKEIKIATLVTKYFFLSFNLASVAGIIGFHNKFFILHRETK